MAGFQSVSVIEVRLWNKRVGALAADPGSGYYAFEFDPGFTKNGWEPSPLLLPSFVTGPTIALDLPVETFRRLPAFISDSLPDKFGNALIDAWMIREGISAGDFSVLDRLAYIGSRAMGALEFVPAIEHEWQHSSAIKASNIVKAARKAMTLSARELAANSTDENDPAMLQLMRIGTSAGGAKAKAIIGFNPESEEIISGQFSLPDKFEPWLLKIDTGSKPYGCIEYAYYLMAKECGIEMSECRLLDVGDKKHFMTKRFDRLPNGEKVHIQTLCAIAAMDFNQLGTHDYLQIFDVMKRLNLGFDAQDQMFARMVFNVFMANNDDHSKNHSFILKKGGSWELAPAYDMMFAYDPENRWTAQHATGVNGKFSHINRTDILEVARRTNIKDAETTIDRTMDIAGKWMSYAEVAGVDEATATEIDHVIKGCLTSK